jgi:hypothetical protein
MYFKFINNITESLYFLQQTLGKNITDIILDYLIDCKEIYDNPTIEYLENDMLILCKEDTKFTGTAVCRAIEMQNFDLFKYLVEDKKIKLHSIFVYVAYITGNIPVIKYLKDNNLTTDGYNIDFSTIGHNLIGMYEYLKTQSIDLKYDALHLFQLLRHNKTDEFKYFYNKASQEIQQQIRNAIILYEIYVSINMDFIYYLTDNLGMQLERISYLDLSLPFKLFILITKKYNITKVNLNDSINSVQYDVKTLEYAYEHIFIDFKLNHLEILLHYGNVTMPIIKFFEKIGIFLDPSSNSFHLIKIFHNNNFDVIKYYDQKYNLTSGIYLNKHVNIYDCKNEIVNYLYFEKNYKDIKFDIDKLLATENYKLIYHLRKVYKGMQIKPPEQFKYSTGKIVKCLQAIHSLLN